MIISTQPGEPAWTDETDDVAEAELRSLLVEPASHGQRLDRVLAEGVPEFSRSYLQQLIDAGLVQVQGRVCTKPALRVQAGQRLQVELRPTPQSQAFRPEAMALDVVHRDEHLLVLHKPAGLVVHPAPGHWSGTLLNGLLAEDAQAATLPRAGIVHRLDKDTSGLMMVARSRQAMDVLVQAIAAREVSRQYLALAHRPWNGPAGRSIEAPIGRDPRTRLRMAVVDLQRHSGKPARTDVRLLANAQQGCWVQCSLHTGRTHQIRVHMAHIGHPLVGDALYDGAAAAGLQRQALHAWRLALRHPVSGQPLEFRRDPPPDLLQALAVWGLGYNQPAQA